MKKLVIVFTLLSLFNCASDDGKPTDEKGLIGTWKLIEQYLDPGDGSGTFQPIEIDRSITFLSNGTVTINGELCFISNKVGDKETGSYMIITDSDTQHDGEIIPNTCSSRSVRVYFDLPVSGHLILWYQCIEGCAQKFEKVN